MADKVSLERAIIWLISMKLLYLLWGCVIVSSKQIFYLYILIFSRSNLFFQEILAFPYFLQLTEILKEIDRGTLFLMIPWLKLKSKERSFANGVFEEKNNE